MDSGSISSRRPWGCSLQRRCSCALAAESLPSVQNCSTTTTSVASSATEQRHGPPDLPEEKRSMEKTTEKISPAKSIRKTVAEDYDLVILGGGTGSTVAAWTFASEGKHVAVVDRKYIGGSCPNIACLPSKNIIHSAKVASYFCRSKEFGIVHDGFTIDMGGVRERKRKMVSGLNAMYLENYKNTGAEFILGAGRFIAPGIVEVAFPNGATRQLRGTNVIVSTGTRATVE